MTPEAILRTKIDQLRRRVRWLVIQRWTLIGFAAGLTIAAVLAAVARLRWWPAAEDFVGLAILLGAAVGAAIGLARRISPAAVALLADRQLALKDRLSTALEFASGSADAPAARLVIADAAAHARTIEVSRVFPWRFPREVRWAAVAGAIALAVLLLPALPWLQSPAARAEAALLRTEGERLRELARQARHQAKESPSDRQLLQRIARELERLGRDQQRGRVSRKEAMLTLRQLQEEIAQARPQKVAEGGQRTFADVARDLASAAEQAREAGKEVEARQLAEMAQAMQQRDGEAAKRLLERIAEAMKQDAARREQQQLRPSDLQRLADSLQKMAESLQGTEFEEAARQLSEAAKILREGAAEMQRLLEQAAQTRDPARRQQLEAQARERAARALQEASRLVQQAGGT